MRIVMFSMTPLYPDKSMGGAQKQLKKVAMYLAQQGHDVTILCTRRHEVTEPFHWHEHLEIVPIFRFKQPYPEPYFTPPYNIAHAIQIIGDYLKTADVFYSHDGGLIFPYVYQDIPTVISLRSVIYPETIQSGFLFQGDALIVPSQYGADCWQCTAGRFFPQMRDRIHVVHNGLDWQHYQPTASGVLAEQPGINPAEQALILYPHRPREDKGIHQTIAIAAKLVHEYHLTQIRVLVPQGMDYGVSASVTAYYQDLKAEIAAQGLEEHFIFHEWISDEDMPAYYSMGTLMLAVGNCVESAANTPIEALACGTMPIVANVAAYRDILGQSPLELVDYNDIDAAAARAAQIIHNQKPVSDETRQWIHQHFAQHEMVASFADIILNAKKLPPIPYQHQTFDESTRFQIAPWCYLSERGVYHDFKGDYLQNDTLIALLTTNHEGIPMNTMNPVQWRFWYEEGYLVPLF